MTTPFASRALSPRFDEALALAADLHRHQERKGSGIPYIAHLLSVAALVIEDGGDEEEAIAALLHDSLEDHPEKISRASLESDFSGRVAEIVQGCSDTPVDYAGGPKPDWRTRKEAYLAHLRTGPVSLRVSLADKLHNARAILADYRIVGDELWERFTAGREGTLWYYRALVGAFREGGACGPMLEALDETVGRIEELARASGPADLEPQL